MKVGVYSLGYDGLAVLPALIGLVEQVDVFFDDMNAWVGDLSQERALTEILPLVEDFASNYDYVIVPSICELVGHIPCIPLYHHYLKEMIFHSRKGKIGVIGTRMREGIDVASYGENKHGHTIKTVFHEQTLLHHMNIALGKRNFMISKICKFMLRFYKERACDTLVRMDYGFWGFEKLISGKTSAVTAPSKKLREYILSVTGRKENSYPTSFHLLSHSGNSVIENDARWKGYFS